MVTETSVHARQLRLAIIDDDANVCSHLGSLLEAQGHQAVYFQSSEGFLDSAKSNDFDCILLELWFKSGISGLELLRLFIKLGKPKPTVMMSALPDVDSALEAGKLGVSAILAKPLRGMQVWNAVQQAITPLSQTSCIPQHCTSFIAELLKNPESLTNTRWNCLLCQTEQRLAPELFSRLESLSRMEAKVFLLLALQGLPNKTIGKKLNDIGKRTVETHRSNVFRKLGVRTAMQLRDVLDEVLKVVG